MSTDVLTHDIVAERLRSVDFDASLGACTFRFWTDEILGTVVEVVLILDFDHWNEAAAQACDRARSLTSVALGDLPCFPLLVCRTRAEHESFADREAGLWTRVREDGPC